MTSCVIVFVITHCYPLYPLISTGIRCYPLISIVSVVTHWYSLLSVVIRYTHCYPLLSVVFARRCRGTTPTPSVSGPQLQQ